MLLHWRANVSLSDQHRRTPLVYAAESGCAACVRLLLRHGSDAQHLDVDNRSALWLAQDFRVAELLVKRPAVGEGCRNSRFGTKQAAYRRRRALRELFSSTSRGRFGGLLRHKADPKQRDLSGRTPEVHFRHGRGASRCGSYIILYIQYVYNMYSYSIVQYYIY